MPKHGELPYFFPGGDKTVEIDYTVCVTTQAEPAEDATLSEARVYKQTVGPDDATDANKVDTGELQKQGSGTFDLAIDGYTGEEHSPLLVKFVFEKEFSAGPKAGTRESGSAARGVVLADPDVAEVKADPPDAKPDEQVTLEVTKWGALMWDLPGGPPTPDTDPENFPSAEEANVKWRLSKDGGRRWEDLPDTGKTIQLTIAKDQHLGKTLVAQAYFGEEPGERGKAQVLVPALKLVDKEGEDAPASLRLGDEVTLKCEVTPALAGEFTWEATGSAVALEANGATVKVKGVEPSGGKDDVTLKCKLKSKASEKEYEVEHKLTVDAFDVEEPQPDTVWLAGTTRELKGKWKHDTRPRDEKVSWVVEHNAELEGSDDDPFQPVQVKDPKKAPFAREGRYRVAVRPGMKPDEWVKLQAVALDLVELTYVDARAFDGDGLVQPELRRDDGQAKPSAVLPAWYLAPAAVKVKAKLKAKKDLTQAAKVVLSARGPIVPARIEGALVESPRVDPLELAGPEASVEALAGGVEVEVQLKAPLSKCGAYDGDWTWKARLDGGDPTPLPGKPTRFRLLVTYKEPVEQVNVSWAGYSTSAAATMAHVDAVARWAGMKDTNDGRGICYQLDNNLRHWVSADEQQAAVDAGDIVVPDYPAGTPAPTNYEAVNRFRNPRRVTNGRRAISNILYPMTHDDAPHALDHLVADYDNNYATNFGWKVFDNPSYPGGRCNQQASLIVDVMGLHGVKAEVLYLERVGTSKDGRPCYQGFKSDPTSDYWNFHGVVRAQMADGSWWCYDGSFSSPPGRINGSQEKFEKPAPAGPFLHGWGAWVYSDDQGGDVPPDKRPTTYKGRDSSATFRRGEWGGIAP